MLSKPLGLLPSSTHRPSAALPAQAGDPVAPGAEVRPWVCLCSAEGTLVAERIQISTLNTQAPLFWLRPLLLVWQGQIWELTHSPDVLWAAAACQPAYAEDVMPWLAAAQPAPPHHHLLQQFLQHLWATTHSGDPQCRP